MTVIQTAITDHVARIAIMGDSISEGPAEIAYADGFTGLVEAHLRREFDDVDFTFGNFSISGRGIGEAYNAAFVGANPENPGYSFYRLPGPDRTPPSSVALWPGGVTIGKAWRDHVRDFSADAVIVALGANVGSDIVAFKYTYENLLDYMATWPKSPTPILVTPIPPVAGAGGADPVNVNAAAQAIREIAAARGLALADANTLYNAKIAQGYTPAQLLINNINHPNELCSRTCYFASFAPFLSSLKSGNSGEGSVAYGYSSNSLVPISTGDYIDVLIGGAGASAAFLPGSGFFTKQVLNAASCVVSLRKSSVNGGAPVTVTSHTLTFPHAGNWQVSAFASSTSSGSYNRHALMSIALKPT